MPSNYILCGVPRGGTTYTQGILQSTKVAGYPEEVRHPRIILRLLGIEDDKITSYCKAARKYMRTPNGVWAAQIFPYQIDIIREELGTDQSDLDMLNEVFDDPKFVWLHRRDRIAHAVSTAILRLTSTAYTTAIKRAIAEKDLVYERPLIDHALEFIDQMESMWTDFFTKNSIAPLECWFEDTLADPQAVVDRVLEFIDVDPETAHPIKVLTQKQGTSLGEDWVKRYEAGE